ncbi:MAG: aminotransferase class V-fold PLP-dependent enzyme [Eubacteriales bacterium]|nr:aminotransferase class V-fold PLP-dependent enzyme [Eubacteriales bacterium]
MPSTIQDPMQLVALDGRTLEEHRRDFPVLERRLNGRKYCYLNPTATSLKPSIIAEAMRDYYLYDAVSAAKGADGFSHAVAARFAASRNQIAKFIGASDRHCIIFTRGATSALNMICYGLEQTWVESGDEVVVSDQEHHANYVPWQQLCLRKNLKLCIVKSLPNGSVDMDDLRSLLNAKTKIVALAHQTNVMGARNPIAEIATLVHEKSPAVFVVDGAQGIVHERVNVEAMDIDFYAFSAHKLFGPTGLGVFYGKRELLERIPPIELGGEMIGTVDRYDSSFAELPSKFEAGTMPAAEVLGFKVALDYVENTIGFDIIQEATAAVSSYALDGLLKIPGIEIYNAENVAQSGIISFNVKGVHPHDAASVYDHAGIALRAGHHCAQRCMAWLGQKSTLRASFSFYNTFHDADRLIACSKRAGDFLDILF